MITVVINQRKFMGMMTAALKHIGSLQYPGIISNEMDIFNAEYQASDRIASMARTIALRCMEYVEEQDGT